MSRRGHLSHKVPNAKNRPVPAPQPAVGGSSSTRRTRQDGSPELWREAFPYGGGEDVDMSSGLGDEGGKPWKGVVITITGSENKVHLTGLVKELGGKVETALTIHTTHVIASSYGSAKYTYAIEHHIPVVLPSWIIESHQRYLAGEELDYRQDMDPHRLMPFSGLNFAMSGINPLSWRKQIIAVIQDNGGNYSKDLDRSCTHLISALPTNDPNPSDKIKWALRENADRELKRRRGAANLQDMKIIYEEWLWDCVAFKGRFPEEGYDARKSRKKGKVKAQDVLDGTVFQDVKPDIKKVDTKEDDEPAMIRKRKRAAMDSLVGDIMSISAPKQADITVNGEERKQDTEPVDMSNDKNEAEPSRVSPTELDGNMNVDVADPPRGATTEKMGSTGKKDESGRSTPPERQTGNARPDRPTSMVHLPRTASFANPAAAAGPSAPTRPVPTPAMTAATTESTPSGPSATFRFFDGLRFSHIIEQSCEALEKALVSHGGILVSEQDRLAGAEVDYIVVRLNSNKRPVFNEDLAKRPTVVTEIWVEGCRFEKRMLSPDEHLVFRPLPATMPVPGAERLQVHLSGLSTASEAYLKRLLKAIGGNLADKLTRNATHLIRPDSNHIKAQKCLEWNIPVVSESWLLAIGRSGQMEPAEPHLLPPPTMTFASSASRDNNKGMNNSTCTTSSSARSLSVVSKVDMDVDFNRSGVKTSTPRGEASKTGETSSPVSSVGPSRLLKLAPTHVDPANAPLSASASRDSRGDQFNESLPLSAPCPERERALNKASSGDGDRDGEPVGDKISRIHSAPTNGAGVVGHERKSQSQEKRSQSAAAGVGAGVVVGAGLDGKKSVTEALKQLAERGETTPRDRAKPRRTRPGSRLKSTITPGYNSITASASPRSDHSFDTSVEAEMIPTGPGDGEGAEESMRIQYVDPNSEREKKRLRDALRKSEAARRRQEDLSPSKRQKV